jgi:hypothetical protein
MQAISSWA